MKSTRDSLTTDERAELRRVIDKWVAQERARSQQWQPGPVMERYAQRRRSPWAWLRRWL
jgi:hypothetical protein